MEELNEILKQRREKLGILKGKSPVAYPNAFKPDATAGGLFDAYGNLSDDELQKLDKKFRIAGRIISLRSFGKAGFMHIQDRTGKIQIYLQMQILGKEKYRDIVEICEVGDFIGVSGGFFKTRTGEFTLKAEDAVILVKSLNPLPEKWHGLKDIEIRYRQRYLDLIVNKDVKEVFKKRAEIIKELRSFLDSKGFLEVETPMMQSIPGGAAAKPFVTHHNALNIDLYLRIAPELFLKRLVVGGMERVYEINRNFRNEGISTVHNPEFTMLEFYAAYATYEDLMDMTQDMFQTIAKNVNGSLVVGYNNTKIDFGGKWKRLSFYEAVEKFADVKKPDFNNSTLLASKLESLGGRVNKEWPAGKILTEIFDKAVEPKLIQPTFIYGYPVEVSPLARRNDADQAIVDRFELYISGLEVANAFSELNDPEDQRQRFLDQMKARDLGDEEAQMIDEDYVRALEHGMPPTAGEGVGIDRLVMLLTGSTSIRDVILFPLLRPER